MTVVAEPVQARTSKLPVILLVFALAVPVITLIATVVMPQPGYTTKADGVTVFHGPVRIYSDDMEPESGGFTWRYFQWGIFEGARLNGMASFFRPWLGYETGNYAARMLNPVNPTPFLITVILLACAGLSRRLLRQEVESDVVEDALTALNRCDGCNATFHNFNFLTKVQGKGFLCDKCRSNLV